MNDCLRYWSSAHTGRNAIASDETRRAVELYDSRVEAAPSDSLSTTGSIVWTEAVTLVLYFFVWLTKWRSHSMTGKYGSFSE
jgi:hypothetical protein